MASRLIQLALLLVFALVTSPAVAVADVPMEGRWNTGDEGGVVEVYEKDGAIYGRLVAAENDEAPIGVLILRDFQRDDGTWTGRVYSPRRKRTYPAQLRLEGSKLVIRVRAGLISKTLTWTR